MRFILTRDIYTHDVRIFECTRTRASCAIRGSAGLEHKHKHEFAQCPTRTSSLMPPEMIAVHAAGDDRRR